jgi:hypothetical protein
MQERLANGKQLIFTARKYLIKAQKQDVAY